MNHLLLLQQPTYLALPKLHPLHLLRQFQGSDPILVDRGIQVHQMGLADLASLLVQSVQVALTDLPLNLNLLPQLAEVLVVSEFQMNVIGALYVVRLWRIIMK